jgi:hypothetical protein
MNQVFFLHDNTRLHESLCTREVVATVEWIVLPHPSYSLNLACSDFHLFVPWRIHSKDFILWMTIMLIWNIACVKSSDAQQMVYTHGWELFMQRWEKYVSNRGQFVEK